MKRLAVLALLLLAAAPSLGQTSLDSLFSIRGLAIAAPRPDGVDDFVRFIREELIPRRLNTLVLRVDYNYEYASHPELRDPVALSRADVRQLVEAAREGGIRIIPQVNLLGHQSWAEDLGNLLEVYPEFDETPHVAIPDTFEWPNDDGLYCKSYCPLHPEVHRVVFALMDEIVEAFETDAFHAGMDEVFYIADDQCPRCSGRDPAELFAGEVTRIRNHLASEGRELWIWGDRLIDGKTTGIGMWEASMNNTHRAIDFIPKDVVIADWHYTRAVPTAPLFALKGLRVVSSPWRIPEVGLAQIDQMLMFRAQSPDEMKDRFAGILHTVWSPAEAFLDRFYGRVEADEQAMGDVATFNSVFAKINALDPG